MLTDIVKPGGLEQVLIKMQHNTCSGGRSYSSKNFVPIVHEYILVLKKLAPYILDFQIPLKNKLYIRDSRSATWRDVVFAVLKSLEEHHPFQISTEKWKGMRRLFPIHTGRIKSDRYSRCIRILYPKAAVSGVLLHEPTDKKVNSNSLFYRNPVLIVTISSIKNHYSNFFLISVI